MADVHATAVVDPAAVLAADVVVGPLCHIGPEVTVGAATRFGTGCVVQGPTVIGARNVFHGPLAVGGESQAKAGQAGRLEIGDGNTVREFVTINRATAATGVTRLGDGNWLMACSHVAHDCQVGDHTVIANAVLLGGEVAVGDRAVIGGAVAIHQQCRIGTLAIIGGGTIVRQDVPPFANHTAAGGRVMVDINRVGLERAGHAGEVEAVRTAYRALYREGLSFQDAIARISDLAADTPVLAALARFLAEPSKYGLVRPRSPRRTG